MTVNELIEKLETLSSLGKGHHRLEFHTHRGMPPDTSVEFIDAVVWTVGGYERIAMISVLLT